MDKGIRSAFPHLVQHVPWLLSSYSRQFWFFFITPIIIFCGYCYSGVLWYNVYIIDAKSALNKPLYASSFPSCLDPTTLLIADVALAAAYGLSIAGSGPVPFNAWCLQYNQARQRAPAATRAHGLSYENNCQLAFALSGAVWLSHRDIIMIRPWVRLGLQGEIKWSRVNALPSAFLY